MKPCWFKSTRHCISTGLGLFFCFLALLGTASAQTAQQSAERARAADQERILKDAQKLVDKYGLPCEVIEASELEAASAMQDGKKIELNSYEVACKNLQGFLISQYKSTPFGYPISCNQAQAINKIDPQAQTCRLKPNRTSHYWLGDTAKSKIANCQIAQARWINRDPETGRETYEISCKNAPGGIFIVPSFKSQDKSVVYLNCIKTEDTPLKCQNTSKELMLKTLLPLVQKAKSNCEMNNARYVGGTKDADYYEIGCLEAQGFILETAPDGSYRGIIGCDKANSIGGCKFTNSDAITKANLAKKEAALSQYRTLLTTVAVSCSASDYNLIGKNTQTGSEVVEFKCPEAPYGLMAIIPAPESASKFDSFDCFAAKTLNLNCQFMGEKALLAHLQSLTINHKAIKSDCVLSQARYAFIGNGGSIVMELACVNNRGYIAVLNKARTALNPAVACHIAAASDKVPEKCTIAGNGTNRAD